MTCHFPSSLSPTPAMAANCCMEETSSTKHLNDLQTETTTSFEEVEEESLLPTPNRACHLLNFPFPIPGLAGPWWTFLLLHMVALGR